MYEMSFARFKIVSTESLPRRRNMHQAHLDFLAWAEQYEEGVQTGRSLQRHEEWIKILPCPVLRIEDDLSIEAAIQKVLGHKVINGMDGPKFGI